MNNSKQSEHNINQEIQKQQKKQPKTPKTLPMAKIGGEKIPYDLPEIDRFFDAVFHAGFEDGEYALGWYNKGAAGYPSDLEKQLDKIENTQLAKACYYATATVTKHEDGKLYNRKALFKRFNVIVLDDIGTKIPESKIPADFVPNYIIESSEGNYQYGYILETPLEDYEQAKALIEMVHRSGLTDKGGKLVNKKVRMPCGINGKEGDKGDFKVNLVSLNNDYWTPEEILDAIDSEFSWEQIKENVEIIRQGQAAKFSGTSSWSPIKPVAESLNGIVDPVLEWLYENDKVINDNGDCVDIVCPWHEGHTDGNVTAGYFPVGRGDDPNRRGFHCFHDHCSENHTAEFLQYVAEQSGIEASIHDYVAELVASYVMVASDNAAYKIKGVDKPVGMPMAGFSNVYPRKVPVYGYDGKQKMVAESKLWVNAPNRVTVQGLRYDMSQPERIIQYDGSQYINLFAPPTWGRGSYDQDDVNTFKQFIEYLIPDETERDYFMQWLAAKAQNMTFKGAAVLMVAPSQGTGRTTLTDMVTELFNANNVRKVTFDKLCGAGRDNAYNDFMESAFVTCDEIMSGDKNKYQVYEPLKELFDPRPKHMVINTKYGKQRSTTVYTSFLLLTNHRDAIGALGGDRRVYVISNPDKPASPEYFTKLNEWLEVKNENGQAKWAKNVWRYLQTIKTDLDMLNAPAPVTQGKVDMVDLTNSEVDIIKQELERYFNGVINAGICKTIALRVLDMLEVDGAPVKATMIVRELKRDTHAKSDSGVVIAGKAYRVRFTVDTKDKAACPDTVRDLCEAQFEAFKQSPDDVAKEIYDSVADRLD